jgi:general secretion pathway protein K
MLRTCFDRLRDDRGFVLILVIGALALLALAALAFAKVTNSYVRSVAADIAVAKAEALADAGVNIAILATAEWRRDPNQKPRFAFDGSTNRCVLEAGEVLRISVQDVSGRVDLNAGDERHLAAVFRATNASNDEASKYARAITQYRTGGKSDDELDVSDTSVGSPRLFIAVEELGRVPGLPPDTVRTVRSLVTIHSGRIRTNPRFASINLLRALAHPDIPDVYIPDEAAFREAVQLRDELAGMPGRPVFVVKAQASSGAATFVREATVEFHTMAKELPRLHTWTRGSLLSIEEPDTTPAPCFVRSFATALP